MECRGLHCHQQALFPSLAKWNKDTFLWASLGISGPLLTFLDLSGPPCLFRHLRACEFAGACACLAARTQHILCGKTFSRVVVFLTVLWEASFQVCFRPFCDFVSWFVFVIVFWWFVQACVRIRFWVCFCPGLFLYSFFGCFLQVRFGTRFWSGFLRGSFSYAFLVRFLRRLVFAQVF